MFLTHVKTLAAIGLLTIVCFTQNANTQTGSSKGNSACPDDKTYTGKYRNLVFGFSIIIPAGLKGYWNSARCAPDERFGCVCMGDHGRFIPLANEASIEAFVGYQMEPEWNASEHEKSEISSLREQKDIQQLTVISSRQFRLGRLTGRRFIVEFVQNNQKVVRDHIIALQKDVEYELILRTTASRYRDDTMQFEKVIASWKLRPRLG